jgi:hypothetical protein
MNTTLRLLSLAAITLSASAATAADFVSVSRVSEITFNGTNLDTGGGPGNDVEILETDLQATFQESTQGYATNVEPGGAFNTGIWFVSQYSTIDANLISTRQLQVAQTATDHGSPAIYTDNDFEIDFEVTADTSVLLDGSIVGSSAPANEDFARVMLKRGVATLFNSNWDAFGVVEELLAGETYTLVVQVDGQTIHNGVTQSSAQVELSIVTDTDGDGLLDPFDNCIEVANADQRDTNSDGLGNLCDPDLDDNSFVGVLDFQLMRAVLGTGDPDADLDGDGMVDANDLAILRGYLGGPPGP